jgi:hypothetical protein
MEKKLIETLQFFVFFRNDCIKYFNGVCQLCEVNEQQKTISQNELIELGIKIKKIHHSSFDYDKPKTNPIVISTKYGAMAIFEPYYFKQVKEVSIMLYNELTEYTLKYGFNKAIISLLNTKYNEINDFEEYQCLNEIDEFKTVKKFIDEILNSNNEQPEPIAPEPLDNYGITAKQRFFLLDKIGIRETELFKGTGISQNAKHKLLAKILSCDVRTAKGMFNKETTYQMSIDNQNDIEKMYNKITKNKDI